MTPPDHTPADDNWRVRQAFLATMRHDLRTPLNAIIGYSEMLLEDCEEEDPENFTPQLQYILDAGKRLLLLVNDILDQNKIANDPFIDVMAYCDRIHFALRSPLNIVVGFCEILEERSSTLGHDVFVDDLQKIDQAGQRLEVLLNEMKSLATMAIQPRPTQPAEKNTAVFNMAEDAVTTMRTLEEEAARSGRLTGHLLVVDDDEENREILARRLVREGHQVTLAINGREALDLLRQHGAKTYDVVLTDVMMPEMNGYEVLKEIKADPNLRDIPVIFLSALDDTDSVLWGIEMGAQDYLPKPFNQVLLRARIGASLEKKRLRDLELAYMHHVQQFIKAAAAVEAGEYKPDLLDYAAKRTDELGRLARVFQNMAYEIQAREARLKQEVKELKIQINRQKEEAQVAEIVESDYFQTLQQKTQKLKALFDEE